MPIKPWKEFNRFPVPQGSDDSNFWGVVIGRYWVDSAIDYRTAYVHALDNAGLPVAVRDSAVDLPYPEAKEFLKMLGYELVHGHELRLRYESGGLE